jgi:hypothetical protein
MHGNNFLSGPQLHIMRHQLVVKLFQSMRRWNGKDTFTTHSKEPNRNALPVADLVAQELAVFLDVITITASTFECAVDIN